MNTTALNPVISREIAEAMMETRDVPPRELIWNTLLDLDQDKQFTSMDVASWTGVHQTICSSALSNMANRGGAPILEVVYRDKGVATYRKTSTFTEENKPNFRRNNQSQFQQVATSSNYGIPVQAFFNPANAGTPELLELLSMITNELQKRF